MYASRNIRLCNKDCVCLFVCPTGATNTENGQIDKDKCVDGCRLCVDACPSHAIHLVMEHYPEPAPKNGTVVGGMMDLCARKVGQESAARGLPTVDDMPGLARLARALEHSCRILAEDCAREAGYMTPQCVGTRAILKATVNETEGEVREAAENLRDTL